MNPTEAFLAHLTHLTTVSGEIPPSADQWREIVSKLSESTNYLMTGTAVLRGQGDMNALPPTGVTVVATTC